MVNKMFKKQKTKSWYSIISFSFFKIKNSITIWFLFLLSFFLFGIITIALFLYSKNTFIFLKNFQYCVLIFNNILLLLFVLLIIIKIFGSEFKDGTYLLLISKPYSRFTLFFLKLISVWILIIFFVGTTIFFSFIIGYICYLINKNFEYLQVYKNLLLKLFFYSLIISFFSSSSILFLITFLDFQIVLLIVVIFCSLFLIGGMPYSLIMSLSDKINLSFVNNDMTTQNYPIHIIKSTINFKRNLEKKLIKYNNLTNKIWNFYIKWDYNDLNKVFKNKDYDKNNNINTNLQIKRLKFYESLGLTKQKKDYFLIENLKKWDKTTKYKYNGKDNTIYDIININESTDLKMKIYLETDLFFKSLTELDKNNKIHQEFIDCINYIDKNVKSWDLYLKINELNGNSLFYFNLEKSYFSLISNDSKIITIEKKLSEPNAFNPINIFNSEFARTNILVDNDSFYNNGYEFQNWIINYFGANNNIEENFKIKTLYVLREIEINILKKIMDFKLFESVSIKTNIEWQKYNYLMWIYGLISKINIIEHWNQIWTNSLIYIPYWFEPFQRSNINFNIQNNYLMSYQDFPISLQKDKKINLNKSPFLNINLILYIFLCISFVFLFNSCLILLKKNII